jgi:hypothetical protein
MNWLKRRLQRWLDITWSPTWLEFCGERVRVNQEIERIHELLAQEETLGIRIKAAEASCRLVEKRLKELEGVTLNFEKCQSSGPFATLGEVATYEAEAEKQAIEIRYDRSAAEARGMSYEEYRAFKEATRGDKLQ